MQDTEEGRSPAWAVSVNGSDPISALAYNTSALVDQTKTTILEGLNIAAGKEFSISWKSNRGEGSGSSKQIGISGVYVGLQAPAAGNTFANWSTTNAGGQGSTGDFDKDGVPNGVEYFFGETGSSFTANPQIVAGTISFPYDSTVTGVTYKVMSSTNLTPWTDVTAGSVVQNGFVKYTLPINQGKIFVRLEVAVAVN